MRRSGCNDRDWLGAGNNTMRQVDACEDGPLVMADIDAGCDLSKDRFHRT